jgi:hypothetical protein
MQRKAISATRRNSALVAPFPYQITLKDFSVCIQSSFGVDLTSNKHHLLEEPLCARSQGR